MHPLIFISGAVSLGLLFAIQEWIYSRSWNEHVKLSLLAEAWGVQFFIWGVLCWIPLVDLEIAHQQRQSQDHALPLLSPEHRRQRH